MANFNFKTSEETALGGGVYKVGTKTSVANNDGSYSTVFTITQDKCPNVPLASINKNHCFKKTSWPSGVSTQITTRGGCNVQMGYYGGSAEITNYSVSGNTATITVSGKCRGAYSTGYAFEGGSITANDYKRCAPSHTVYISRDAIIT